MSSSSHHHLVVTHHIDLAGCSQGTHIKAKPAHLKQYLDSWLGSTGGAVPLVLGSDGNLDRIKMAGNPVTVAGKSYLVPTLRLPRGMSATELNDGLKSTTSLNAGYFNSAPIVVDLIEWNAARSGGPCLGPDLLQSFITALRDAGLHPVGVSNVSSADLQGAALALGLPCFMSRHSTVAPLAAAAAASSSPMPSPTSSPSTETDADAGDISSSSSHASRPSSTSQATKASSERARQRNLEARKSSSSSSTRADTAAAAVRQVVELEQEEEEDEGAGGSKLLNPAKVIRGSVRTGQQVFAEGASLVVLGSVNSGAEVSADGDIHIYGKLTGRALAGLSGNDKARIYATRFNAELVAIADVFTTCDQPSDVGVEPNTPTCISLDEESRDLRFQSF